LPNPPVADSTKTRAYTFEDLPAPLRRAVNTAVDKNGRAPAVLNVTDITGYTDWVLIVSGRSDRHVSAIADGIVRELRDHGSRARGTDGFADHTWDLLDYDDFMIHVFYHPTRVHYDLESMWSDAVRVPLGLPEEVMSTRELETLEPGMLPEFRGDVVFGGYEDEFEDDDPDDLDDDLDDQAEFDSLGNDESDDDVLLDDDDDLDDNDDEEAGSPDVDADNESPNPERSAPKDADAPGDDDPASRD